MKHLLLAVVAVAGLLALDRPAAANGFQGPFGPRNGPFLPFFRQTPVPAFQAAPWYLYYPYNAHFQTPAPMFGAYYAPPMGGMGGGMTNPYLPANNYGMPIR